VIVGSTGAAPVSAYRLPTVQKLRSTAFDQGQGTVVLGIGGGWAIVKEVSGDGSPTIGGAWNVSTGQLLRSDRVMHIWGVTRDGRVLQWVPVGGDRPTSACVDLVPVTKLTVVRGTGLCSAEMAEPGLRGLVSPDGVWAAISSSTSANLVRTADLHAGRWQPEPFGPDRHVLYWDTDTSFVTEGNANDFYRCQVTQGCQPLAMPDGLGDAKPVPNRG
jgi:hypothetical protein